MITSEEDFDYGDPVENPPRIVSFEAQEKEITGLLRQLAAKLDDEGKALLRIVLEKWVPFYLNANR